MPGWACGAEGKVDYAIKYVILGPILLTGGCRDRRRVPPGAAAHWDGSYSSRGSRGYSVCQLVRSGCRDIAFPNILARGPGPLDKFTGLMVWPPLLRIEL
jgi:hypothetical protein